MNKVHILLTKEEILFLKQLLNNQKDHFIENYNKEKARDILKQLEIALKEIELEEIKNEEE